MFLFRTKENAQRKYVDLIKEAAAKWPNWDPPINIHPGDFGTVNTKTGRLLVEGNIYTHEDTAQLASNYHPIQSDEVEHYQIHSYEVRGLEIRANAGADIPDVQGLVFKSRWQFNKKRGAILMMHKPRMSRVPDAFFKASKSLKVDVLKGKYVVYQAWNCSGYYMYLSNRSSEQVTVSLRANVINPAARGGNINPSAHLSWFSEGSSGVRQYAYRPEAVYTPLFCMRSIRKPLLRRDESGPGEDAWYEADVPWDNLDDEGVTEPEDVYDNGSDDDDDDD